jgi:hypothetical protein
LNEELDEEINHPHVCNGIHKCNVYRAKPEDKVAENVSSAAHKLLEKKFNKKWELDRIHEKVNEHPASSVKVSSHNFDNKNSESRRELEGLKNIGKVKSFKNKTTNKEVPMDIKKYENKSELKHKHSNLWRFHHGDEL